jgi:Uma2 family endonuclease
MTITTAKRMSLEDFLTYDDGTHTRYELEDGVLVEMGTESPINPKDKARSPLEVMIMI